MLTFFSLLLLILFFSVMGLSVLNSRTVKEDFALVPVWGFAVLIGLAYTLSANLKVSGANAVAYVSLFLIGIAVIRARSIWVSLRAVMKNGELSLSLAVILISVLTLVLPALLMGFQYFYGDVNFDFFYNSQDSWFLQTHHVLQFLQQDNASSQIIPLHWSADFQGRFGVSLIGAFFSKWFSLDALQFNSLLLNTLAVIFALTMSVYCREFFEFKRGVILLAVFFVLLSAAYVQSYSYYVLGQLSALPVFVLSCIYFKRFLEEVFGSPNAIIVAVLINILYCMYAILSFFALFLFIVSYIVYHRAEISHSLKPMAKMLVMTVFFFCIVRVLAFPEAIAILKGWITTSHHVVSRKADTFIVFSEYLTESFPGLLFGITNYPSSNSIFNVHFANVLIKGRLLFSFGILILIGTAFILRSYASSKSVSRAAKAMTITVFAMIILFSSYFFFKSAAYALYKVQTWFVPLLIPLYVYGLKQPFRINRWQTSLIVLSACVLALNLVTSSIYLADFFTQDTSKHFVNVHGVIGNKDREDLVAHLKSYRERPISLFLTNGVEEAWLVNALRNVSITKVIHNYQPLEEKDLTMNPCGEVDKNWQPTELLVLPNPASGRDDIVKPPVGGTILYQNDSYLILEPKNLKTLVYIGRGAYPLEFYKNPSHDFPAKFRWTEKGIEIVIYSNEARDANLKVSVTPGYVTTNNPSRNIRVSMGSKQYHFSLRSTETLVVPHLKLQKGLSCLVIDSPDAVERIKRSDGIIRPQVSLDPRLTNFAISNISVS